MIIIKSALAGTAETPNLGFSVQCSDLFIVSIIVENNSISLAFFKLDYYNFYNYIKFLL